MAAPRQVEKTGAEPECRTAAARLPCAPCLWESPRGRRCAVPSAGAPPELSRGRPRIGYKTRKGWGNEMSLHGLKIALSFVLIGHLIPPAHSQFRIVVYPSDSGRALRSPGMAGIFTITTMASSPTGHTLTPLTRWMSFPARASFTCAGRGRFRSRWRASSTGPFSTRLPSGGWRRDSRLRSASPARNPTRTSRPRHRLQVLPPETPSVRRAGRHRGGSRRRTAASGEAGDGGGRKGFRP